MKSLSAKILLVLVAATVLTAAPGCKDDRKKRCIEAYEHLVQIAQRRPDAKLRAEFVDLCQSAWDVHRHECLMASKTEDEALDCKPKRLRPK